MVRELLFVLVAVFCVAGCAPKSSPGSKESSPPLEFSRAVEEKSASDEAQVSPKKPWGDFTIVEEEENEGYPWWGNVLLWLPNRVLDVVDVFRADVGVGMSMGAVARFTKYGQVGYRSVSPVSVRVGAFGRKAPFLIEHSSEFGAGPAYVSSSDRKVCAGEIGLGADLFLVGAYAGFCPEEVLDFVTGVFFLDVMDDDIK